MFKIILNKKEVSSMFKKVQGYKKLLVATLVICIVLFMVGYGGTASGESAKKYNLIIGTGGVGGTYFPLGGALARVWTLYLPNVNVSAQSTGASVENTKLIERGEIELGLTQNDLAEYAYKKQYMFDKEYKRMQAIARIYPEIIQIFVRKGAGIQSISDIKGKRVSVSYAGSGSTANCEQILGVFDITFDDIKAEHLGNPDAADRMRDGLLDVVIVTTGAPNATFQEMAIATDIDVLSFSDEELGKIMDKYPFFSKHILPANTYQGQTAEAQTVSVQSVLVCQKELDEELVYNLTKTMWEKREELGGMIAAAKYLDPENPLLGITIDVHPGAKKYYEETGMWKK